MYGYQQLMQETNLAYKNFNDEFNNWRKSRSNKDKKESSEPESVIKARNKVYQKLDVLYGSKIEPLERKFNDDPSSAIDELFEFLSIDIPAFRSGYAKEVFLQRLKKVCLSAGEREKLKSIALKYCETENVRREFRRWCRLMIKNADPQFIEELEKNLKSDNNFARFKSRWMLKLILNHRADLNKEK